MQDLISGVDVHRSFVQEYVRDYDGINALLRMGFSWTEAHELVLDMMQSTIVQNLLMEHRENFSQYVANNGKKIKSVLMETYYRSVVTSDKHTVKANVPEQLDLSEDYGDEVEAIDIAFHVVDARADDQHTTG